MNKRLEAAIAMARELPDEEQDALAEMMAFYMRQDGESLLTPEQIAEVERRIANPNPEFIDADEVFDRILSELK